ncbi:MAG TPA: alpha/beta fold hydrolase [Gammaproteobacteria bacterium]|nr:alpha/beta fold hydrolase [Gammaproteobacteria bacterium]
MQSVSHQPQRAFRAPFGLRHRHVQSLLAAWPVRRGLLRQRARGLLSAARAEILDCGDGVRLLGMHTPAPGASRGLAILLHGWEGSAEATYVLSVGATLHAAGFDVFRLNFRDHGDTFALNRDLFHSCRIDEVVGAVRAVIAAHPAPRAFVIGHSLGGNFALRVAARAPAAGIELDKVVAICPVLKPQSTMHALETGLWIYREYFLRRWRRSLLAKAACFPELYDFGDLRRFSTLTATTEFFVKQYTGFPDLDAYLSGYAVTGNVLSSLRVPTRLIAAADDPVIPVEDLRDLATPRALVVDVLPRGGHCAFLESYGLSSWIDRAVLAEVGG